MLIEKPIPYSYIFNKVKRDVFRVLLFSAAFHLIKHFFVDFLPHIPLQLPTVLGTSISLILAFNINQSYDRWWEARKIWGAIVNDSRSLVLQLKTFIQEHKLQPDNSGILRRMAFRQIAWCYCLGNSLRGSDPLAPGQEELLSASEVNEIGRHNNKPLALLDLHMKDLRELYEAGAINPFQQVQLDSTIVRLCDSMGKAERINNTVFPVTYRLFTHMFIFLFLIILSLALVESVGWYEVPLLTLIASTFFLIEKTARHMQDPFRNRPTDTAVTSIARTIEINTKQLLEEREVPKPLDPEEFYIM